MICLGRALDISIWFSHFVDFENTCRFGEILQRWHSASTDLTLHLPSLQFTLTRDICHKESILYILVNYCCASLGLPLIFPKDYFCPHITFSCPVSSGSSSSPSFKDLFYFFFSCIPAEVRRGCLEPPELELRVLVKHSMWVGARNQTQVF